MDCAIVRGIWGDGLDRTGRSLRSFVARHRFQISDVPEYIFTFGRQNTEFVHSLGYNTIELDPLPFAAPRLLKKERTSYRRYMRWGQNYYWHKARIMQEACRRWQHVLWLDFDVFQTQALPCDYFELLATGSPVRSPLCVQRNWRFGATWRTPEDKRPINKRPRTVGINAKPCDEHGYHAARILPSAGLIYMRNRFIADELMEIHHEHPEAGNMVCLAAMIDQWFGKWIGVQEWVKRGFEPPGYYYMHNIHRPVKEDTIWQNGDRQEKVFFNPHQYMRF